MESIITSQKSVADIKDPLIKSIVTDISSILKAELAQTITAFETPNVYPSLFSGKMYSGIKKSYESLSVEEKGNFRNIRKTITAKPNFKTEMMRLGVDLKNEIPASQQVNYQKTFGHLKGKGDFIENRLGRLGRTQVVPFASNLDPEVKSLIGKIKKNDTDGQLYADYIGLLDKSKLMDLYKREFGEAASSTNFLKDHIPTKDEMNKIRRLVKDWEFAPAKPEYPKYQNRYLRLKTTRVKCVDETEHDGWGEGIANDRIDFAAVSVAPNGSTTQFGPQMVSDNFEDTREFPWEREIALFDLTQMGTYPMSFGTTVTIAEIDYGSGFANTVKDIYNAIKGVIVEVLTKIGEIVGGIFGAGEAGKIIGKVVGELVVLGLGELLNIISRAVQDDVFTPQVVTIQLESRFSTPWGVADKWPGPFVLPEEKLVFNGAGGAYEVYCAWELIREQIPTRPSGA